VRAEDELPGEALTRRQDKRRDVDCKRDLEGSARLEPGWPAYFEVAAHFHGHGTGRTRLMDRLPVLMEKPQSERDPGVGPVPGDEDQESKR